MMEDYHTGLKHGNAKRHKLFAKFAKGVSRIYKARPAGKYFFPSICEDRCTANFHVYPINVLAHAAVIRTSHGALGLTGWK